MEFIPPIFQAGLNKALNHSYSSQYAAPLYWDGSLSILSLNLKCLFLSGLLEASMETPNMYVGVFCTGSVRFMCIIIGLTKRKNKTNKTQYFCLTLSYEFDVSLVLMLLPWCLSVNVSILCVLPLKMKMHSECEAELEHRVGCCSRKRG